MSSEQSYDYITSSINASDRDATALRLAALLQREYVKPYYTTGLTVAEAMHAFKINNVAFKQVN